MSGKPFFNGWFIVHRDVFDDPIFSRNDKFSKREAYLWLNAMAVFEKCTINIDGKPVWLERGQISYALRFYAECWGWSLSAVDRYIKKLVQWGRVETQTETGQTVITLCNYDELQRPSSQTETAPIQRRNKSETNKKESKQFKQEIKNPPYSPPFSIDRLLSDDARVDLHVVAPQWDKHNLMLRYDKLVNNGKFERPKKPDEAFLAFCRNITKERPPP